MKLMSPMQRFVSHIHADQLDDDSSEPVAAVADTSSFNPRTAPCGGYKKGKVHFDVEMDTKILVAWKTVHPDAEGNCTIRLGVGAQEGDYKVLRPNDKQDVNGKFACGREQSNYEGKVVQLPQNFTCDDCTLQVEWETRAAGKQFMCADIQVLGGEIADCSGQCTNGAVCMMGQC